MINTMKRFFLSAAGCILIMTCAAGTAVRAETATASSNTVALPETEKVLSDAEAQGETLYQTLPENFFFSSGAGGWATEIFLQEDGSFTGDFHDSEMGDSGEGYPYGTIYVCSFKGKFTDAEQISPFSWSLKLEELIQEGKEGDETIEEEIRYVVSTPYGFEDCEEFILYVPGAPVGEMDEDCLMWTNMYLGFEEKETLPEGFFILYNPAAGDAFVGRMELEEEQN